MFFFRYGAKTAEATNAGLGAAGHALGTAWTVFKLRQVLNPKSAVKPSSLASTVIKTAAKERKKGKRVLSRGVLDISLIALVQKQ